MSKFTLTRRDFGFPRPHIIRLMVGQIQTVATDWVQRDGLYFAKNPAQAKAAIQQLLILARQHIVEALVLPELSVPEGCINSC